MLAVAAKVITVDVGFLAYLLGTGCPILTGLLTKLNASPLVKASLNALLACFAGLLAVAIKQKGDIDVYGWGVAFAQALIAAVALYEGFLKHLPPLKAMKVKTANFGIGGSADPAYSKAA